MRIPALLVLAIALMSNTAFAQSDLKTCSANRAYCTAEAQKRGWKQPQCAEAFDRCMRSGEWKTSGPHGRTVNNVERR